MLLFSRGNNKVLPDVRASLRYSPFGQAMIFNPTLKPVSKGKATPGLKVKCSNKKVSPPKQQQHLKRKGGNQGRKQSKAKKQHF